MIAAAEITPSGVPPIPHRRSTPVDSETAKKISKEIRDQGFKKVQVQIQGEELRVTSPSKDTLQDVMAFLRTQDFTAEQEYEDRALEVFGRDQAGRGDNVAVVPAAASATVTCGTKTTRSDPSDASAPTDVARLVRTVAAATVTHR